MLYLSDVLTYLLDNTNNTSNSNEVDKLTKELEDMKKRIEILEEKIASN